MSARPRAPIADVGAATRAVLESAAQAEPALRPRTWRVLAAVLSLTAGWTRLEDRIGHEQIGEAAGLAKDSDRRNLSRELRELADRGLIVYRPGSSDAGGRRTASTIGLPRPPVGADQGSDHDPRSESDTTPGRSRHRPPVGPDHLPEEPPENPPDPRAAATHRQPPIVAGVKGEGLDRGGARAPLREVAHAPAGVVDQALEELARRELEEQPPGTVRDPAAWRRAKIRKLGEEHRADLEHLARDHRPTTGRELLEIRDRHAEQTRRLEGAATLGRNLSGVSLDELEGLPALREDPDGLAAARAAWHAAQERAS